MANRSYILAAAAGFAGLVGLASAPAHATLGPTYTSTVGAWTSNVGVGNYVENYAALPSGLSGHSIAVNLAVGQMTIAASNAAVTLGTSLINAGTHTNWQSVGLAQLYRTLATATTGATDLVITLPSGLTGFGFYLMPNISGVTESFSVSFAGGDTLSSQTISTVNGTGMPTPGPAAFIGFFGANPGGISTITIHQTDCVVTTGAANACTLTPSSYAVSDFFETPLPAPEPASMALIGTGLFGLGLLRRRKRAA